MKKLIALILSLTFVLALVGCGKTISGTEVYSFPEPTKQIVVSYASQGKITEYTIGSEAYDPNDLSTQPIIQWFYGLELKECEKPETVEGNNGYSFVVDGKYAFYYDDRGSTAFVSMDDKYYEVKTPSNPPLNENTGVPVVEQTDSIPTLAEISQMGYKEVNEVLSGRTINELRDAWGIPIDSDENGESWQVDNSMIITVKYDVNTNSGIVESCELICGTPLAPVD